MFNIFTRNKPKLMDLIPKNFVDIHSHILPGIDDGPQEINESIDLINKMKEIGFSKIVATPHTYAGLYDNTNESICESFLEISSFFKENNFLGYASEYMLDYSIIEKANENKLLTIKNNFVLVEMSFISEPYNLFEIIFSLIMNKYIPIIAHPERYRFLHKDIKKFKKLRDMGCFFQLNMCSLTGYYGSDIVKFCDKLFDENLVDFMGSDFHSVNNFNEIKKVVKIKNIEKLEHALSKNNKYFY